MALTTWTDFVAAHPDKALQMSPAFLCAKGNTSVNLFLLQCDSAGGNLITSGGVGATPAEFGAFVAANPFTAKQMDPVLMVAKGNADNNLYLLEVDSVTGALVAG